MFSCSVSDCSRNSCKSDTRVSRINFEENDENDPDADPFI